MAKEQKPPKGSKTAALDAYGVDKLCDRIIAGDTQRSIAEDIGVSLALLVSWIASDPDRSARVREARIAASRSFDEMAEQCLLDAKDPFGLAKARELASHYRWKASKSNPREYGDKVEIEQRTTITDLTDEQLDAKLAQLTGQG